MLITLSIYKLQIYCAKIVIRTKSWLLRYHHKNLLTFFYQVIEEPEFGTVQVIFPIIRLFGSNGQLNVTWSLILENKQNFSSADDVATTKGRNKTLPVLKSKQTFWKINND